MQARRRIATAAAAATAATVGVLWLVGGVAFAQGTIPRDDLWITENPIEAFARTQGKLFVGGNYDYVGPTTGNFAAVNKSTGKPNENFVEPSGEVFAIESDGAGGWFLGGVFRTLDGVVPRNYLVHLLPDGSLDPAWSVTLDSRVENMELVEDILYIQGEFSEVDGVERYTIAALNAATSALLPWNPQADDNVYHLAIHGSTLYVGGTFETIGGEPRLGLAAFNATTGTLLGWTAASFSGAVQDMAFSDSLMYISGSFTQVGGQQRRRIAALELGTGALASWNADIRGGNFVSEMELDDEVLFIGGNFDSVGVADRQSLAALDPATGAPTAWQAEGIVLEVGALHLSGSVLWVGADINFGEAFVRSFHALDVATGNDLGTAPLVELQYDVKVIAEDATQLYLGGNFRSVGGYVRDNLAVFSEETGEALGWDPDPHGTVGAIAISPDSSIVYVGGQFDTISGEPRLNLAAYDASTLSLLPWAPVVNLVNHIEPAGPLVYISGLNFLAAVTASTGAVTAFHPVVNATVYGVAVSGDTVYACGHFSTIAGVPRRGLAALDASTGAVLSWDPMGASGTGLFYNVKVSGDAVYLGSRDVDMIGGQPRTFLSAVDRFTGLAKPFNPIFSIDSGGDNVEDFFIRGGTLYAGGDFRASGGRFGAAAFDATTGALLPWNPVIRGTVYAMVPADTVFYVAGAWDAIGPLNEHPVPNLVSLSLDATPPLAASGLAATPHGSVDKRVDLAWIASPSADVASYLIYRGTSTLADTTGKLLTVTGVTTSYPDITPLHATYFYKVYARDAAGNIGPASNQASAASPDHSGGGGGGIDVTTAVFQNPALTSHADIVVAAVTPLVEAPSVTIELEPSGLPQPVALAAVPGTGDAWRGGYVFGAEGTHTLRTTVDAGTGDTVLVRTLAAAFAREGEWLALESPDGGARLVVPDGAAAAGTCFLAQAGDEPGSYCFGPAIGLAAPVVVEVGFSSHEVVVLADLSLQLWTGGRWVPQSTTVFGARAVARASLAELGAVRLVEETSSGGAALLTGVAALRQNAPNPFTGATRLEFDLAADGPAELTVYNVLGQRVKTLRSGMQPAGRHAVSWDGTDEAGERVARGVYFARLASGAATRTIKMSLAR